ncbi:hypothetical protein AX16_001021 [Volvariella volvacea WC 439]|nr:hypothetical protein AX16_001021 [Volvariella volvacea WC 439]
MNVHSSSTGVTVETVNLSELYDVLAAASSQDPSKLEASSKRIKQMFDMFGTYNALHEIAAQRNVPLAIRQQAIIQFKNAALGHWRSRKVLSDEHKLHIRQRSLMFLDEEDETIATCNQVVIAKLARQDYPANWPNLLNDLMTVIDTTLQKRYQGGSDDSRDTLMLRRSLKLLNAIIKELASVKMPNGIKIMAQVAEQLQTVLYQYYSNLASTLSPSAITMQTIGTQRVVMDILFSHLVYKCATKIAAWTWNRIDRVPKEEQQRNTLWVQELFKSSVLQVKALTELRTAITTTLRGTTDPTIQRAIDLLYRHIRAFGKWFRRLQQLSSARFTALPTSDDLVLFYWALVVQATSGSPDLIADSNEAVFPTRFLVQGMVLFKENLVNWTPVRRDGSENPHSLSQEFVQNALQILITRFMPLNPKDLESWMADPEEWVNIEDKENDLWEYEIRPCSERVLLQLTNQYPQYATPYLDTSFKQIATQPSVDLPSVIQKEALYCAIGRCAHKMKDVIPFGQWLEHTLASEARDTNPNYPLIKRRIAWMIGKWVYEGCTSPKNPRVWDILVHLLVNKGPGTDNVVRFTAARALKDCVDTIDFDADIFHPYLPAVLKELMDLIEEADTFESKQRIGQSLVTVIEQCGDKVIPLMNIVAEPLPKLWLSAGDQWLFKATLLVTLDKLILVTKEHSAPLVSLVAPLVREGLSPAARTFLDEDTLNLWQTALRNSPSIPSITGVPGASLPDLFPMAMQLLKDNPDLLTRVTTILDSYCFLDASGVLQAYALDLFRAYLNSFESKVMQLTQKDLLASLQFIVQLAPSTLWGEALHASGLFPWLLSAFLEGENVNYVLIETECLFARIILADPEMFCKLMSAAAPSLKLEEKKVYELFMDQWWGRFDAMSEPRQRKLIALATAALVSTCHPSVLTRLPGEIFNLWLDVLGELKEVETRSTDSDDEGYSPGLKRHWDLSEAPDSYLEDAQGTLELERRRALYNNDPVRNVRITTFVAAQLRSTEARIGPHLFHENYLSKADPTVLKQLQDELARS